MLIENLDKNAVIKWRLSDACNFKCSYCIRKPLVKEVGKEDDEKCIKVLPEIIRIAKEIYRNSGKKIKVDLIGGEVTVLPSLDKIISELTKEDFIEKVNITTNAELIDVLKSVTNTKVSITCSYHPTQTKKSIENWFYDVSLLCSISRYVKVETVAVKDAKHIEDFVRLSCEYGLDYQVEEDLFNQELTGKACSSKKKNMRYRVTDDNGVVKEFPTRNIFLKKYGINGCTIWTGNKECTRDFDYIYIEKDEVYLCSSKPVPVSEYHPVKGWHPCWRINNGNPMCTLCGNLSIRTIKEFVF